MLLSQKTYLIGQQGTPVRRVIIDTVANQTAISLIENSKASLP